MSKKIPLTQGLFAIVDDRDFAALSEHKWCALVRAGWPTYAVRQRSTIGRNGRRRLIHMHRIISDCPDGLFVDHINGDGLDNRRANLRTSTIAQNNGNIAGYKTPLSGYRGVKRDRKKWMARMSVNNKTIYLGSFPTPELAFDAYKAAHIAHHGEYSFYSRLA